MLLDVVDDDFFGMKKLAEVKSLDPSSSKTDERRLSLDLGGLLLLTFELPPIDDMDMPSDVAALSSFL